MAGRTNLSENITYNMRVNDRLNLKLYQKRRSGNFETPFLDSFPRSQTCFDGPTHFSHRAPHSLARGAKRVARLRSAKVWRNGKVPAAASSARGLQDKGDWNRETQDLLCAPRERSASCAACSWHHCCCWLRRACHGAGLHLRRAQRHRDR